MCVKTFFISLMSLALLDVTAVSDGVAEIKPSLKIDFENWNAKAAGLKGVEVSNEFELSDGYDGKGWNCKPGSFLKFTGDAAKFIDASKGTVSFWFRPDWSGLDGKAHFFMYAYSKSPDGKGPVEPTVKFSKGYSGDKQQDTLYIYCTPGSPNAQAQGGVITPFKWVHLAATWNKDANEMAIYLNGRRTGSGSMGKFPEGERGMRNPTVVFGADETGACSADGTMDDIEVFNVAMSQTEVNALFTKGRHNKYACPKDMEADVLEYLKGQDLAKFENNPWLSVKSEGGAPGNGPEMLFTKRSHHGYWRADKLPASVEADLGRAFKVEAVYVEDSTWEDFGAGRYEILVYDNERKTFASTEPASTYMLTDNRQKGHRKIFAFKPVMTDKVKLVAYEGRGVKPKEFCLKRLSVFSSLDDALKFEKEFLFSQYEAPKKSGWAGSWIWHPDFQYKTPEFKKEFDVDGEIEGAKLQGNAKNWIDVKVNGASAYKGNGEPSFLVDISKMLRPGANTISACAGNRQWPGGVILEALITFKNGKSLLVKSDDSWKVRPKDGEWEKAAFLTQDVYGRWQSKPVDDFNRKIAGFVTEVCLPSRIEAGAQAGMSFSLDLRERIEGAKDAKVEFYDSNGVLSLNADATFDRPTDTWTLGRRQVKVDFHASRYLTPGEYVLKLKVDGVGFLGEIRDGVAGKTLVTAPAKAFASPDVKVRKTNGRPTLSINGKDVYPMFYLYHSQREMRLMADAGIRLYAVQTYNTHNFWKDYGVYKLDEYERLLRELLERDPSAYIMIDLSADIFMPWWTKRHPDDRCILSDGKPFVNYYSAEADSFGSETAMRDSAKFVSDIVSRFENSPFKERIVGYRFYKSEGGEWYAWYSGERPFPDHSPAMTNAFRRYLKGKYGDVASLRKAWNSEKADFESAEVPSDEQMIGGDFGVFRDMKAEQPAADYFESVAHVNERYMEEMLKSARRACGAGKLLTLFYGYTYELWEPRQLISGHMALNKLLNSGLVDMLCAPHSYFLRYAGEQGAFFQPVDSISAKGVMYFDDSDFRTHLSTIDYPHDHIPQDTLSVLWRHYGIMGQKGYTFAWHGFGEWFISPEICDAFAKMSKLGQAAVDAELKTKEPALVPEKDRIAFVVSEKTPFVMGMELKKRLNYYLLPIQREAFPKIGASFDMLLLEELLERKEFNYKAYVFLNAFSLSDEQRKIIKERIAVNGNVIAWFYAPGLYNGQDFGEANMKDLTGFSLKIDRKAGPLQVTVSDTANPLTGYCAKGDVFGNAGEPAWPRIYCDDKDAKVLGFCPPENRCGLAVKDMGSWKSVFIAAPRAPASLFRGICKMAGVHLYTETDLTLYPNNRSILIYPDRHMETEISFPGKVRLFNVMDGKWLSQEPSDKYKLKLLADKPYIYQISHEGR